jgi:hypothetical protein
MLFRRYTIVRRAAAVVYINSFVIDQLLVGLVRLALYFRGLARALRVICPRVRFRAPRYPVTRTAAVHSSHKRHPNWR